MNPSWEIAKALPSSIPGSVGRRRVRIITHPQPVKVSYAAVHDLIGQIYDNSLFLSTLPVVKSDGELAEVNSPQSKIPRLPFDAVLHIGMAGPRRYYAMERQAHKAGYNMPDVEGKLLPLAYPNKHWLGCPETLSPTWDLEDVYSRWKANVSRWDEGGAAPNHVQPAAAMEEPDVRVSDDAGHYLCDFIYYSSLAWHWQHERKSSEDEDRMENDRPLESSALYGVDEVTSCATVGPKNEDKSVGRPVMFLHVPGESTEKDIVTGKLVALSLIEALVASAWGESKMKEQAFKS